MMGPRVTFSCAPSLPARAPLLAFDSIAVWRSALSYPTPAPFAAHSKLKRHQFVTLARHKQQQLVRRSATAALQSAAPSSSDHSSSDHSDSRAQGAQSSMPRASFHASSGGGRYWVPGTVLGVCAAALVLGTDAEARPDDPAAQPDSNSASEPPNPHQKAARQLFMLYDTNGDGVLTIEEMREALARHHGWDEVADSDLHALFHVADTDGDNMLSLNEFVSALEQVKEVNTCFKRLDARGTGTVDVATVASFIADMVEDGSAALIVNNPTAAAQARRTDAEYLARLADTDKDGKLHLQEFCHLYLLLKKRKRFQEVSDVFSSVPVSQLGQGIFQTGVQHWSRIYQHMYLVDGLVPVYEVPSLVPRFLLGGTACGIATLFTSPMDVLKVRMQTANSASVPGLGKARMSQIAMEMAQKEGFASFWLGLQPAMHRAYLYSGFRLALYGPVKERLHGLLEPSGQHPSLLVKIAAGGLSGAFAAWASNPAEVVKNRIQAMPRAQEPSSVTAQILRTEGVRALFIAVYPNMLRGGVMTASQVATYDHIKHALLSAGYFSDGLALYFVSSMLAGVVTATAISPFDIVKTKIMSQDPNSAVRMTSWQCFRDVIKEGPAGMFRGWLPQWGRLGPHTVITLMVFERIREALGISGI